MNVSIKLLSDNAVVPKYAHIGDAGLDLHAAESLVIQPFERMLIPTGIAIAIPEGYGGFVLPRSGCAYKQGLGLANSPGLIDSHYRGEIKVAAINLDPAVPIEISIGDRIAQLVISEVPKVDFRIVNALDETVRSDSGFGSTGA